MSFAWRSSSSVSSPNLVWLQASPPWWPTCSPCGQERPRVTWMTGWRITSRWVVVAIYGSFFFGSDNRHLGTINWAEKLYALIEGAVHEILIQLKTLDSSQVQFPFDISSFPIIKFENCYWRTDHSNNKRETRTSGKFKSYFNCIGFIQQVSNPNHLF